MDSPLLRFAGLTHKEAQSYYFYLASQSSINLTVTLSYNERFKGQAVLHDPPLPLQCLPFLGYVPESLLQIVSSISL